jgi:hypothetical protein
VSSPGWGPWPDFFSCMKFSVLFNWGALSDERSGLSFILRPKVKVKVILRLTISQSVSLGIERPLNTLGILLTVINPQSERRKTQLASLWRDTVFTEALLGNVAKSCLLLHSNQRTSARHGMEKRRFPYCFITLFHCCATWQLTVYEESVFVLTHSTSCCPRTG